MANVKRLLWSWLLLWSHIVSLSTAQINPIRLALVMPFFAKLELLRPVNDSVRLAVEEINASNMFGSTPFKVDGIDFFQDNGKLIAATMNAVTQGYNGIIGEIFSSGSKLMSYTLSTTGIFQCSCWATSPALANKKEFPTFFRLTPDDNLQALVMLKLVQSLKWTRIGVFASTGEYAQGLADVIRTSASNYNIQILEVLNYDVKDEESFQHKIHTLKASGVRIILFLPESTAESIRVYRALDIHQMIGPQYVYITPDVMATYRQNEEYEVTDENLLTGSLVTVGQEYSSYSTNFVNKFKARYGGVQPQVGCATHYDAVWAFAYAFKNLMIKRNLTAQDIANNVWKNLNLTVYQFLDFTFQGATGPTAWHANGNLRSANFEVRNIYGGGVSVIAQGTTESLNITAAPRFHSGSTQIPTDQYLLVLDAAGYNKVAPIFFLVIAGFLGLVSVASVPLIWILKEERLLKPLSPEFMAIAAAGMALCALSIFPNAVEVPTESTCNLFMAMLALGVSMIVGSLLVKMFRLYRIFENRRAMTRQLGTKRLLFGTGSVVFLELILVVVWSAAFPLTPREIVDIINERRYYECASSNTAANSIFPIIMYVYNGLLISTCCYFAFATRNIYSMFNETKAIGVAIYNVFFCVVIILIITYVGRPTIAVGFYVRSAMILFGTGVSYCLLTGRYLLAVMRQSDSKLAFLGLGRASSVGGTTSNLRRMQSKAGSSIKDDSTVGDVNQPPPDVPKKSKPLSTTVSTTVRMATFTVRGKSSITSGRWQIHTARIVGQPVAVLLIQSESEQDQVLAIPLMGANVSLDVTHDRFSVLWSKGNLDFQAANKEEAEEWASFLTTLATEPTPESHSGGIMTGGVMLTGALNAVRASTAIGV
ncbi:periplasmic binding protein-like I [Phlyctochytrium arcticum]|nr:periplasmic binding protein-like I [Phlyctochytrium arcticum]